MEEIPSTKLRTFFKSIRTSRIHVFAVAILTIGILIFGQTFAAAGVPKIINFQGRLLDSGNNLLGGTGGTNYCFRFSLYDAPTGGTKLWPATTPSTMTLPVREGVFDANIGDTTAGGDALDYNFQDSDSVYVNVEVAQQASGSCSGVSFETLTPRQRVVSSGYAINSGTLSGYSAAQSASGNQIPVLTNGALVLGDAAAAVRASGTTALTIQGGGATGNIQFFGATNTIDSSGNLTLGGGITAGSTTVSALSIGSLSGVLKASGGVVSGNATTDDIPEGSTNQYFQNSRAIAALTGQNISIFTNDAGYLTGSTGVSSFNTRTGAVTLNSGDVTTALGYTPQQPYWTRNSGSGYLYTSTLTDMVGIGTTSPNALLSVGDSFNIVTSKKGVVIGDSSNGGTLQIGSDANNWVQFYTNTAGKVNFDTKSGGVSYQNNLVLIQGRVGIGNSSPSTLLQVSSSASGTTGLINNTVTSSTGVAGFQATNNVNTFQFVNWGSSFSGTSMGEQRAGSAFIENISSSGKLVIGNDSALDIGFITNSARRMTILGTGNVGIGTGAPDASLVIASGVTPSAGTVYPLKISAGSGQFGGLLAERTDISQFASLGVGTSNSLLKFSNGRFSIAAESYATKYSTGSGTELFTVLSSGNVGIGNTAPSTLLHVGPGATFITPNGAGTTAAPQIINSQTSGTSAIGAAVVDGTNNYRIAMFADNTNSLVGLGTTGSIGVPSFVIRNASTEYLRILGNGNVGVNTTAPNAKLESLSTTEQLRLSYDATHYTSFTAGSLGSLTVAPVGGATSITGTLSVSSTVFANAYSNSLSSNNALVSLNTNGTVISRNVADTNPALIVNQANVSSTGSLQTWQFNSANIASINSSGTLFTAGGISNPTTANALIGTGSTGVTVSRNVADANAALLVNQANASSTGFIQNWQFAGTSKAAIDAAGTFYGPGLSNLSSGANSYVQTTASGTVISRNVADANVALIASQLNASSTGDIFQAKNSGGTVFSVTKTGNVGIGTTAPTYLTDIQGGGLRIAAGTATTYANRDTSISFNRTSLLTTYTNKITNSFNGTLSSTTMNFELASGASTNINVLTLDGGGRAGFGGVTAPTHTITLGNTSTGLALYNTADMATNYERMVFANVSNTYTFSSQAGGTGTVRNFNFVGANLGIGAANPTTLLSVGSASVATATSVATFQNAGGTCTLDPSTTGGISCSSDMNLKKNITSLSDGTSAWSFNNNISTANDTVLQKILALNPVDYNWNVEDIGNTGTVPKHAGFIAQEVQQVFPDLVSENPSTHLLALNYVGLMPYTIEAIKEMNVTLQALPTFDDPNLAQNVATFLRGIAERGEAVVNLVTAKKVRTQELCIGDDGDSVCVTKDQLRQLLQANTSGSTTVSNPPTPDPTPSDDGTSPAQDDAETPSDTSAPDPSTAPSQDSGNTPAPSDTGSASTPAQ